VGILGSLPLYPLYISVFHTIASISTLKTKGHSELSRNGLLKSESIIASMRSSDQHELSL
jgi:hypothetical protein